jgi:hypothetical protein
VPVEVLQTARAEQQVANLRKKSAERFELFLDDLAARGCEALGYRLTGPLPLDHLCVKHLDRLLRVVVGFRIPDVAWIVLVGPHDDRDPGIDVYSTLYKLAGVEPADNAGRDKPPCCTGDGPRTAPALGDHVEDIAARARSLRRTRT